MAKLLKKLLIEQTKSRSRQTNDNALAESKNASSLREHPGYSHIPQAFANQVNAFTIEVLTPQGKFVLKTIVGWAERTGNGAAVGNLSASPLRGQMRAHPTLVDFEHKYLKNEFTLAHAVPELPSPLPLPNRTR